MKTLYVTLLAACAALLGAAGMVNAADRGQDKGADALRFKPVSSEVRTLFMNGASGRGVLAEPDYYVWCFSAVKWTDGKYHGYYARWPKALGFDAWISHCEVAHAVADKPEGPYKFVNVVLEKGNPKGWDVINAHNPWICVADGKLCLYYISNDMRGKYEQATNGCYPDTAWFNANHTTVRNSQRIGVAIATSPEGPFVRSAAPVVEPHGMFKNIAVNPAVLYHDGKYTMIMKGDDVRRDGWFRIQLVGHSDRAEGPFKFEEKAVYDKAPTEDACIWYNQHTKMYYMACHVMGKRDLALLVSNDSYSWRLADNPLFMKKQIVLDDGTVWAPDRVERPFVLTDEEGKPIMLFVAVSDGDRSGNIAIPIE